MGEDRAGDIAADGPTRILAFEAIKGARLAAEKSRAAAMAIHADDSGGMSKSNAISGKANPLPKKACIRSGFEEYQSCERL